MITLTLTGASISDLREQMHEFLGLDKPAHPAQMELIPRDEPKAAPAEKPFDLDVTKKRTRRTKEQIEADKLAKTGGADIFANGQKDHAPESKPIATPTTVAPVSAPAGYSKQHVHEALQQVNVAVGLPKSREILQSFGANRISEIKEDQFKAFVEKCNEAVMQS